MKRTLAGLLLTLLFCLPAMAEIQVPPGQPFTALQSSFASASPLSVYSNGEKLGRFISYGGKLLDMWLMYPGPTTLIYSDSIKAFMEITSDGHAVYNSAESFTGSNCSGNAYLQADWGPDALKVLPLIMCANETECYKTNAATRNVTVNSYRWMGSTECINETLLVNVAIPLTPITLP